MRRREEAPEEALMLAYVGGDAAAFRRLFQALSPSLLAFFRRSVGEAAAQDLAQTTFMKLHASRDRWRPGERLRPWVFTIAARARADWLRRQGRAAEEALEEEQALPDPSPPVAGEALLARERDERVRAALEGLTPPQRAVVHLHRFEGLSFAQIGEALGISEGAAKLRAFRAYDRLRVLLADVVAGEGPRP